MVMEILGNLGGLITPRAGTLAGGKLLAPTQMPFKSHVGITNGDTGYAAMADVLAIIGALAAGSVFTKVWEMTVPAQQRIAWGFGSPALPHNQGYMWFCSLNEAGTFQVGVLRLVQCRARDRDPRIVLEVDDTRLHTATVTDLAAATPTNINEMIALPEKVEFPLVGEDSKLQLWYRCITASAVAEDNVGFSIPITVYQ